MHIEVIQTDNHPTGAGQMATPLVAPAIASAVAELTGVRLRHTPFLPDRVKKALVLGRGEKVKIQTGAPRPVRPSYLTLAYEISAGHAVTDQVRSGYQR